MQALAAGQGKRIIRAREQMLCLTDMWRASAAAGEKPDPSRRPADWLRSGEAQHFIEFLADALNVGNSHHEIVHTERGGAAPATWAHWQIGMAYAKYLSPAFHACS